MHVIAKSTLEAFAVRHADAAGPLGAWYDIAKRAHWRTPQSVKRDFPNASIIGDNRVIFDIKGNDYRLVVRMTYRSETAFVCFIGTHAEYDRIDPETVNV